MKNNTWFNIALAKEGTSSAEISIYDTIGGHEINAKDFVEQLNEIKAETIHLRINSPGGSVIDGIAIFNGLLRHEAKVITHIDGLAASMASVIAMAGSEVHMSDNALLMIHNPWTMSIGDADELRADAELLDKMSASILNAYSRSQYEDDEIKDLMDKETWFTAQEALEAGLVDHIDKGLRASASDITALAVSSEFSVPFEKQIVSMTKQIEAVTKTSNEISDDLNTQTVRTEEISAELSDAVSALEDAHADLTVASLGKLEAEEQVKALTEQLQNKDQEIESKNAEISQAEKISEEAVSAKAAEIIQTVTHEPVADSGEGMGAESDEQLLARYESISDKDDRRDFFSANKTKILRAKARLNN